jgi:hypothetical protein
MSLGPGSSTELKIRTNLSNFILEQSKYAFNLGLWDKFIIWRYTLGSGSLNSFLIGLSPNVERTNYWCFLTFTYYNYPVTLISPEFKKYTKYFNEPAQFSALNQDEKLEISLSLIKDFVEALRNIVMNAPVVREAFVVYKTSGEYPGLPDKDKFYPKTVLQLPFNSTTYDPQFNFAPFTSPDSDCCMFILTILKGSHVLYIPSELHAYPHEREVLLPPGCSFNIVKHNIIELDYISLTDAKFIQTQTQPVHIGEVYRVDPLAKPIVKKKKMNLFLGFLVQ